MKKYIVPDNFSFSFNSLSIVNDFSDLEGLFLVSENKSGDNFEISILPLGPIGNTNSVTWSGSKVVLQEAASNSFIVYDVHTKKAASIFANDAESYDEIIVDDDLLYIIYNGHVVAYDFDGVKRFNLSIIDFRLISSHEDLLIFYGAHQASEDNEKIFAFTPQSLKELWSVDNASVGYSLVDRQGKWLVVNRSTGIIESDIEIYDARTGTLRARQSIPGRVVSYGSAIEVHGNHVYVLTDQDFYCFDIVGEGVNAFAIKPGHGYKTFLIHAGLVIFQGGADMPAQAAVPATFAVYDRTTGALLASRVFEGLKHAGSNPVLRNGFIYCLFTQAGNRHGMRHQYLLQVPVAELTQPEAALESELALYRFERLLDQKGFSSYRIFIDQDVGFARFLMHLEAGAATATYNYAFLKDSYNDSYPDEDFAGEFLLDCRSRSLSAEEKGMMEAVVQRLTEAARFFKWQDAIKGKLVCYRLLLNE